MRLVTYNIHKGIGGRDRRYRLDRILDVLLSLEADIVCLQEVTHDLPRTSRHDQSRLISTEFPDFEVAFQQNVHWKIGGYGNLLLSRWPIHEQHRISLRFGSKKPRGVQLAVLSTPHGLLRITNWHLGLSERERQWQVAKLLNRSTFRTTSALPTLIVGDFNDWRNTLGHGQLHSQEFVQITAPPARYRTFPATLPVMSLDKVFHNEAIIVESVKIPKTRLTRQASDHLPVVVNFHIAKR